MMTKKIPSLILIASAAILTLPLPANATESPGSDIPVNPTDPDEGETGNRGNRLPARKPKVTITDGTLITVERVAEDASLLVEILRDGDPFFSTFTMDHSVVIPMLEEGHTYTVNLTVNGTLWTGPYIP